MRRVWGQNRVVLNCGESFPFYSCACRSRWLQGCGQLAPTWDLLTIPTSSFLGGRSSPTHPHLPPALRPRGRSGGLHQGEPLALYSGDGGCMREEGSRNLQGKQKSVGSGGGPEGQGCLEEQEKEGRGKPGMSCWERGGGALFPYLLTPQKAF